MAYVAVDKDGTEKIYSHKPKRVYFQKWIMPGKERHECFIDLPKGTIKKLIGRTLTWEDEPVELKEE